MTPPVRLTPSLCERVWGRKQLAPWFPDSEKLIGEAWYLGEGDLPILVKMLFTSERLSVQVHPDDGEDGPRGKTEMWHIVEAEPGATIALGFREPIARQRLLESTRTGEIEQLLHWFPVRAGDTFFVPAHTVHAIGAGIVLFEIQQNSDVTYRLWDYNRPRELHVEKAVAIADLGAHPGPVEPRGVGQAVWELARCPHFVTQLIENEHFRLSPQKCELFLCLRGAAVINGVEVKSGEVWLAPNDIVKVDGQAAFLHTFVPGL
jgi:mannose-6-phosphate isomerase